MSLLEEIFAEPPDIPTTPRLRGRPRRSLVGRIASALGYREEEPSTSAPLVSLVPIVDDPPPLNTSTLALPPQRRRNSVSPSSPNVTKKDTCASARRWIQQTLVAEPNANIRKVDVLCRYSIFAIESGEGGVAEATLEKYIKEIFPDVTALRIYTGIRWVDATTSAPPPQPDWGEILSRLRTTTPTLRRVPRGARMVVAQSLTRILNEVTSGESDESWRNLLLFSYAILPVPQKSDQVKNLTTWVKNHVATWDADFSTPQPLLPRPPSRKPPKDDVARKVEAKLADGDIRGAIRLACSDDTIAPNDDVTFAALIAKHPQHPQPINLPRPPENQEIPPMLNLEASKAISTFPPGSAGGLDGMRPQILKDLVGCNQGEVGEDLIKAITAFLNLIMDGGVPPTICPILYGASLTALKKKTGGIRPIAVGNTWRRLAAKVVVARITPQLIQQFSPHQLGVGIKGGAEIGAHAART